MTDRQINSEIEWTHLEKALDELGYTFIREAQANLEYGGNPPYTRTNASYDLSRSMKYIIKITDTMYEVDIELLSYWKYVNGGSKPHWPKVDAIKQWIQIKPLYPHAMPITYHWYTNGRKKGAPKTIYNERTKMITPTVDQLAYLIGRKISREGTQGTGFFDKAKESAIARCERNIEKAIVKDVDAWIIKQLDL